MLYLSSILHISCKEKSSFALIVPDCVVEQRIRKRLLIKSQLKFIPCILYFKSLTFYKDLIKVAVKRSDHFFYFRLCFYCSVSALLSPLWIDKAPLCVTLLHPEAVSECNPTLPTTTRLFCFVFVTKVLIFSAQDFSLFSMCNIAATAGSPPGH